MRIRTQDTVTANTCRRILFNDIPTYAIHKVTIVSNTTMMTDEMVAFALAWVCLRARQPSSIGDILENALEIDVIARTSGMYQVVRAKDLLVKSPKIQISEPDSPIFKIAQGQRLALRMDAPMGFATQSSSGLRLRSFSQKSSERIILLMSS